MIRLVPCHGHLIYCRKEMYTSIVAESNVAGSDVAGSDVAGSDVAGSNIAES